jgi:hypothetical protein
MERYDGWLFLADRYRYAKPLISLMESMTHREYELRLEWLKRHSELITGKLSPKSRPAATKEEATLWAKAKWLPALGLHKKK